MRLYVGRDKLTGKRLYDAEVIRGSQRDAKSKLNEKLAKKDHGQLVPKTFATLGEYLGEWVETIAKARVREVTFESYKYHLKRYLPPGLLATNLSKVRTIDIQAHYNSLTKSYSARTVRYVHSILSNALKKAVQMRLIPCNPCDFAELPRQQKNEVKAFTPEAAKNFLDAAGRHKDGLIFELALLTGARPEEYPALRWADVDFSRACVTFRRALIWRKGGGFYFDEQMKTSRSKRTISLPQVLLEKLRRHRVEQAEVIIASGPSYSRDDLVFATPLGTPTRYGNLTRRSFHQILKHAGLGHYTLYSLRHSCATLLLSRGENIKVIQERLGHADITLTLSTYSHVLQGMQVQASKNLGSLFYEQISKSG